MFSVLSNPYFRRLGSGVPPLPIPNREVKPARADGTAQVGEWVSAVLVFFRVLRLYVLGTLFLCLFFHSLFSSFLVFSLVSRVGGLSETKSERLFVMC